MRRPRLFFALVGVLGAVSLNAPSITPAWAGRTHAVASATVPNPGSKLNVLSAVTTIPANDNAWAVGAYRNERTGKMDTLTLHWQGSSWSRTPSPNATSISNFLNGVSAVGIGDVWAVGATKNHGVAHTLILHWNGRTWARVASPNPSASYNVLNSVHAIGPDDIWAGGTYQNDASGFDGSLLLHWNGSTWSVVNSPGTIVRGIGSTGSSDVWSAGYQSILHWDGYAWTASASLTGYAGLNGVTAVSPSRAWAVGFYETCHLGCISHGLIMRWNGSSWLTVTAPFESPGIVLSAVEAASRTQVWAVGGLCLPTGLGCVGSAGPVIMLWNGAAWSIVTSPSPGTSGRLNGVSSASASDAWAVGDFKTATGSTHALILHWDGTSWS